MKFDHYWETQNQGCHPINVCEIIAMALFIPRLISCLLCSLQIRYCSSCAYRILAKFRLEQIPRSRGAWEYAILRFVWPGWQLETIKYWCVSVSLLKISVWKDLSSDMETMTSRKLIQVSEYWWVNFMVEWNEFKMFLKSPNKFTPHGHIAEISSI